MSATEGRHEDAPKKVGERIISEERPSWIETRENAESGALAQRQVRGADQRFEMASGATVEWDVTRHRLLGAIGGTEIARSIRGSMPADPHARACADPPNTPIAAATPKLEPSVRDVKAARVARPPTTPVVHPVAASMPLTPPDATPPRHPAASEPGSILEKDKTRYRLLHAISKTEIAVHLAGEITGSHPQLRHFIQTSRESSSVRLMPPAAVPPRHAAPAVPALPPELDSVAEKDKTRDRLLHAISGTEIAGHLGGEIPASHPQLRHFVQTSPESASVPLMPATAAPPHRPVSATPRTIEAASCAAVPQIPLPPQPVTVAGSATGVIAPLPATAAQNRSPRTTPLVRDSGEKNHLSAKLALTAKRVCRATTQLSIQFRSCVETKVAPAMKRLGRSAWQYTVRFENRAMEKAALATQSTGRAATQLSIQFKNWIKRRAAPAVERLGRSAWQILTGLDDFAHAAPGAPAMESTGQSRTQPSTWLEKWFDPRQNPRLPKPPVIGYCWTANIPLPVKVADISSGGVHLITEACWPPGGVLSMTLQRTDRSSETPESWIVIDFRVIRLCDDGVAGAFIPSAQRRSRSVPSRAEDCADDRTLKRFVSHLTVPGY